MTSARSVKRKRRNPFDLEWPVASMFARLFPSRSNRLALAEAEKAGVQEFLLTLSKMQASLDLYFENDASSYDFRHLEHGDGGKYGAIYAGGQETPFRVELPENIACESLPFQMLLPMLNARELRLSGDRIVVAVSWSDRVDMLDGFKTTLSVGGGYQFYQDRIKRTM